MEGAGVLSTHPAKQGIIAYALAESANSAALRDLGAPAIVQLIASGEVNTEVADRLMHLDFPRLVRIVEAACRSEAIAARLRKLELQRIVGLYASAAASGSQVTRLRELDTDHLLYFFENAIRDESFDRNLHLFEFPTLVRGLETAFHGSDPVSQLGRVDYFRIRRMVRALLGAERLAANPESLDAHHVLADRRATEPPRDSILGKLEKEPHQVDFFWALRAIQALNPNRPKIGASLALHQDYIRLRQEPDLSFAPSTLRSFRRGEADAPSEMSVNFMGLFGPNGALPVHLTDYVIDRLRNKDAALARFLDILQHRVLSFFFRAWAVHDKAVDLDRAEDRRFANYFASFIGLGMPALRDRDAVPDMAKLYFSGRLACPTKNPEGLAAILSDFFGVPCEIQNFCGHWITLPEADICRLGESAATGTLGSTAIVGSRVYQYQTKFRIRLGPMGFADFSKLLPCEDSWPRLRTWVWNYIGQELFWDAQYVLRAAEVPAIQLGAGALLGWTTWLVTRAPEQDAEDVLIDGDWH